MNTLLTLMLAYSLVGFVTATGAAFYTMNDPMSVADRFRMAGLSVVAWPVAWYVFVRDYGKGKS